MRLQACLYISYESISNLHFHVYPLKMEMKRSLFLAVQVHDEADVRHLEARVAFLSKLAAWQSTCMESMLEEIQSLQEAAHGQCPGDHLDCKGKASSG